MNAGRGRRSEARFEARVARLAAGLACLAGLLGALFAPTPARGHAMLPGVLVVDRQGPESWTVQWRPPEPLGDDVQVGLPRGCPALALVEGRSWSLSCAPEDLWLEVHGGREGAEVLVVERAPIGAAPAAGGRAASPVAEPRVSRLAPGARWRPGGGEQAAAIAPPAPAYLELGVEHILLGFDHLAFVFGLLLLVCGFRRVAGVLTAFTLAHSLTLGAAALGWVHVPGPPVEATIALSVVFVARAAALGREEEGGRAFAFALAFGLLHGLGFAGALGQLGLPRGQELAALALFNVGVELGQLAVVAGALGLAALGRGLVGRARWARLRTAAAYGLGVLAALWTIERVAALGGLS